MINFKKNLKAFAVVSLFVCTFAYAQSKLEKVTYLLPAPTFLPAFAPWVLANHLGYYESEGLEVSFQSAKGGVDVAKQVGVGNAVVGGAIGDTPIIVRSNGILVKSVAVLGGRSLMQLAIRADSGVKDVKDLKGKTVTAISLQDTTYYALLGMLAKVNLDRESVNVQPVGPAGVWKLFVAGEAQAMAAVPDWIGLARGAGVEVNVIPADKYFKSMAQAILASDKTIKENPELIQKLVSATLKGMKYIMDNPQKASVDYVAAMPQHKGQEKAMQSVFEMYNEYVYAGQEKLGMMDRDRLSNLQDFYLKNEIVRNKIDLDDLYTNQFIK